MPFDYSAFKYNMPAGFPGDVNRSHPASIEPGLNDVTNPVPFYGSAVIQTATGTYRGMGTGDTSVTAVEVAVRPFPIQQGGTIPAFGAVSFGSSGTPPAGEIDVLRMGYVLVPVVGTPIRGGAVFVWVAASTGVHVQGGFEAAATGGSTTALAVGTFRWNSGPDASGIAELVVNNF